MKVKTLIEELQKYDPEARVYLGSAFGQGIDEALVCYSFMHSNDVILAPASELDLTDEITGMVEHYDEEGWDEGDIYEDMIDKGFTPDVVAENYNMQFANSMICYCASHGIDYEKGYDGFVCKHCINGICELREDVADDFSCKGSISDVNECNYL